MGGAMDLVGAGGRVIVLTTHTAKVFFKAANKKTEMCNCSDYIIDYHID